MTASQWVKTGALVMFTAVALGDFGAHGLKNILDEYEKSVFETGVRYQMVHGLALFIVAWLTQQNINNRPSIAGYCFLAGIVLFSGSLYVISLSGMRKLGIITPLGGIFFLAGWAILLLSHV